MSDYTAELKRLKPTKDYLVAIDSDGCVFDAMNIKQKECFCPMMIAYFGLQPVAQAARQCKEFADIYSKTRGANRHKTMARILTDLLPTHPLVKERGFRVPNFEHYIAWVNAPDSLLSNQGLAQAVQKASGEAKKQLEQALKWSLRVDEMVEEIVKNVPPFPYVRQSLEKVFPKADIMVCSSTPVEALIREWQEHDLARFARIVAGQEMGKKAEHLAVMAEKYEKQKILMIGDALGDQQAAEQNGLLFYPINPDGETASWKRFHDEAFDRFLSGRYAGEYQQTIKKEFQTLLLDVPDWQK